MAFRLADPGATYPTPVAIAVPVADGRTEKLGYILHFRLPGAAEVRGPGSRRGRAVPGRQRPTP